MALFKDKSILVNTARGELIDQTALIKALQSGKLAAAGLDVFEQEPVNKNNPLLNMDNVVLTPHIAWLTPETLKNSLDIAIDNCIRVREGRPILNRVI